MKVGLAGMYQRRLQELELPPELIRKLRRADDFIRLAVVAASALLRPEILAEDKSLENCGLILGTAYGTMQTNFEVLDAVVFGQQSSPTLFSHSVFNAAAGYVASIFNLQGCALTITDFSFSFFRALQEGFLALHSGRLDRCLVLQVETYSQLLQDARTRHLAEAGEWQPGVVCWLLDKNNRCGRVLQCPHILENVPEPFDYLQFSEQLQVNGQTRTVTDPLGSAMALCEMVQQHAEANELDCMVQGPWGQVGLQFK